jgi:hypothetical protein
VKKYGRSFEGLGSGIPNKLPWQEKERSEFLCHKAKLALVLIEKIEIFNKILKVCSLVILLF